MLQHPVQHQRHRLQAPVWGPLEAGLWEQVVDLRIRAEMELVRPGRRFGARSAAVPASLPPRTPPIDVSSKWPAYNLGAMSPQPLDLQADRVLDRDASPSM
ncbi:hypothetical protein GCM10027072_73950 [Streptomyces bullii]